MAAFHDAEPFAAGSLWQRLVDVSQQALLSQHLEPIPTRAEKLADGDVVFNVRVLDNLQRKSIQRREQPKGFNPFLPYDPNLFVANVSEHHVALLNKFNVVDHHLLIVTRQFESQDSRLTIEDFEALWRCLLEFDSVGFYNGGAKAGASQPHKHLQLLPLGVDRGAIPLESKLKLSRQPVGSVTQSDGIPFWHRLLRLPPLCDSLAAAKLCARYYEEIVASIGWTEVNSNTPYNLLVTREWLLLVPRTAECFADISLNSMAFAGSLFVKNQQQLEILETAGPMTVLSQVADPEAREPG
ncbi:MAG: phosphorylase [Planctomycetaceae bacterium]|nr:phosphorylase [Planctomycetaceae bacterium]